MHKLTDLFHRHGKSAINHTLHPEEPNAYPRTEAFPTGHDLYCYRKQRGVNLGSWFVLERWITESPFRNAAAPAQSDLDVARGSNAKEILEHHWDTWITETDWQWLAQHGINTVRLPIGYYHICGADPSVLDGTDFAQFHAVFEGAWSRITKAIAIANDLNIGVLLDLHAAPGKQNRDAHSGTSAPSPGFFTEHNMSHTTHILTTLVRNLPALPNVVGIELLNEPQPDAQDEALKRWYASTIAAVRAISPGMPIYISDCWRTDDYAGYISSLSKSHVDFVVLDHHLYRCFTQEDLNTPAEQHARALRDPNGSAASTFARVSQSLQNAGGALVVGEFSGALNPQSLAGLPGYSAEMSARRSFVKAEIDLLERFCAGWFFWTYKKEGGRDLGWGFRDVVDGGLWPNPGLVVRNECERDAGRSGRRNSARDKALAEHASYWDKFPGKYEHFRFDEGFVQGWDDAYEHFLCSEASSSQAVSSKKGKGEKQAPVPVPELGFKGAWAKWRAEQYVMNRGGKDHVWEYEHGLIQGIDAARKDFIEVYCEGGE